MSETTPPPAPALTTDQLIQRLRFNYQQLHQLTPGLASSGIDLETLLREVADFARTHRVTSWQEAWNQRSGATPIRPGVVEFWTHTRCPRCDGRRIDFRMGRACGECAARGTVYRQVRQTVRYASVPPAAEGDSGGE